MNSTYSGTDGSANLLLPDGVAMGQRITVGPPMPLDAAAIASVLAANRDDPGLFQKSPAAVALCIEEFLVARNEKGEVVGCAGLHRDSPGLAELHAVAVLPRCRSQGIGRTLIEACERRAMEDGVKSLWLATIKPEYFCRYGFRRMSRWELPWSVLARKLKLVFEQPVGRWLGAIFGRHTFMRRATVVEEASRFCMPSESLD